MDKTYERINSLFEHGLIDSGISILISVVIVLVINKIINKIIKKYLILLQMYISRDMICAETPEYC